MTLESLKTEAQGLGITAIQAAEYGNVRHKSTWQRAIDDELQLRAEMEHYAHKDAAHAAYQSASAPIVVPLAFGAAVGTVLLRNVRGMLVHH